MMAMRGTVRIIAVSLAMLFVSLAVASPIRSATAEARAYLKAGLVGRISSLADLTEGSVTSDLIMSMLADSLFSHSRQDKSIIPMLADGWPDFAADGKSVAVRLRKDIDPAGSGLFGLEAIVKSLESRMHGSGAATIRADATTNSIVFRFTADATEFWDLFAFAPIFAQAPDGYPVGAGNPKFKLGLIESDGVMLDAAQDSVLPIFLRGYRDQASMIAAYAEGSIDYCSTDLNRTSAQLKGPNWQSSPEAVIVMIMNASSPVLNSTEMRSSAMNLIDRSYLVLRAIPGRAIQSTGLYFPASSQASGSSNMIGTKIRLISSSDRIDSLEMLCSMMVKSWWEADGSSVSLNLPSDKLTARARVESGDYDALVTTVWLRPGFTGLLHSAANGGLMQASLKSDAKALLSRISAPKTFDEMKDAAEDLQELLISKYLVLPLVHPVRTELYRPDQFGGWNSVVGEPLIPTYRDFSRIYAIKP